jgi:hypothetical protein
MLKRLGRLAVFVLACTLLFLQLWFAAALYWWEAYEPFSEAFCASMRLSWYFRWWLPIPLTIVQGSATVYSLLRYRSLPQKWWYVALLLIMAGTAIPLYFGGTYIVCDWYIYGRAGN